MDRLTWLTGPFAGPDFGMARRGICAHGTVSYLPRQRGRVLPRGRCLCFSRPQSSAVVAPATVCGKEHMTPSKRSAHPLNLATNQAKGMVLPTIACCPVEPDCHESGSSGSTEAHRRNTGPVAGVVGQSGDSE